MTNIGLLHEISATFINICINLMRIYQKHAQTLCKIAFHYFPRPKDMPGLRGWDAAVNSLAVNLALEERWYYDDADKQNRPILKNYLSFTFQRLQYEDKLEKEAAAKNNRQPRLKILENQLYAVWNTGLVDNT